MVYKISLRYVITFQHQFSNLFNEFMIGWKQNTIVSLVLKSMITVLLNSTFIETILEFF